MARGIRHLSVSLPLRWRKLAVWVATASLSCGGSERAAVTGPDGWQQAPGNEESPRAPASEGLITGPRQRWADADQLPKLKALAGRERSEHLGQRFERTVRINIEAESYRIPAGSEPLPRGSLVVQHHHRPGSKAIVSTFLMLKKPKGYAPKQGDWQFVVLDAEQRVVAEGKLPQCARCHLEAPHDGLFGPPPPALANPVLP